MASTEPLRVTGPANCSRDANTAVSTPLVQSWTAIDSSSPPYTCEQLVLWLQLLGAREFDEDITDNAEAWAKVLFHEHKLKSGRQWLRVQSPAFFREALQVPPVYAQMFWETIVREDVVAADVQTPVVNCNPGVRDNDLSFSSLDSSVWRELLTQNAAFNREMQD